MANVDIIIIERRKTPELGRSQSWETEEVSEVRTRSALPITTGLSWAEHHPHHGFAVVSSSVAVPIHFRGGGRRQRGDPHARYYFSFNLISQVGAWKPSMHLTSRMLLPRFFFTFLIEI